MSVQNRIPFRRIVVLGMLWLPIAIFICVDISKHDINGLLCLLAFGILATWAVDTFRRWIRFLAATIFSATIILSELQRGPIARHLVHSHPDREKGFLEGVIAMDYAMGTYRPYIIVAAVSLFALGISSARKDEKTGL